jgi:hypothetical protein
MDSTSTLKAISAAYDTGTQRLAAHFDRLHAEALKIQDRYVGQIDVWFDACDLLRIEVLS